MSSRRFFYWFFIFALLVACSITNRQLEDIPIAVSQPGMQAVDIDLVINNAHSAVEKILPNTKLEFFSLVSKCETLSELQGEVHLFFSQTRLTLFGERVYRARVVVDTIQQTMRMKVQNETEQYLSTEKLELKGLSTLEIANALEDYLSHKNQCNNTVALSRTGTNDPWYVRCGPPDKVFLECIEIDPENGKVTELR